jgi:RNA polymerase sigma-70 factor (ECF subfamily)
VDEEMFVATLKAAMADALRMATALVGFSEAEDVVQEATERAWRGRASLRDPLALRPWWLRIVYTTCLNWYRGEGARLKHLLSLDMGGITALMHSAMNPGDSDHTALLDLYSAINHLDDLVRPIIILRYFVGMDSVTIGAVLQLPAPTVRTRLRKALVLLRDQLLVGALPADADKGGQSDAR